MFAGRWLVAIVCMITVAAVVSSAAAQNRLAEARKRLGTPADSSTAPRTAAPRDSQISRRSLDSARNSGQRIAAEPTPRMGVGGKLPSTITDPPNISRMAVREASGSRTYPLDARRRSELQKQMAAPEPRVTTRGG